MLDAESLRTSFRMVDEREPEFAARFYDRLFTRHPQLRPLFARSSLEEQQHMLYQALVAILDNLEDAFWLEGALGKYGERHAEYGVTEAMYDQFGECLMDTLKEAHGAEWTPELSVAWADAYRAISDMMKAWAKTRASKA